jgi:AcrR family transcriptional regulator
MGIAERKERQKTEMRAGILVAAWQLVLESGWQSLSIRKIADAIEYSIPVVYEYFENKEAILLEFNKLGFKLLGDKLKEAKSAHRNPEKQLEAIAYAYWDYAFSHKEYYQVMFGLGMPSCEQAKKMPELTEFTKVIETTINQIASDAGQEINVFLKVQSFWSMIHGLVSINLMAPASNHGGMGREELNSMVLKDFISGFAKGLKN